MWAHLRPHFRRRTHEPTFWPCPQPFSRRLATALETSQRGCNNSLGFIKNVISQHLSRSNVFKYSIHFTDLVEMCWDDNDKLVSQQRSHILSRKKTWNMMQSKSSCLSKFAARSPFEIGACFCCYLLTRFQNRSHRFEPYPPYPPYPNWLLVSIAEYSLVGIILAPTPFVTACDPPLFAGQKAVLPARFLQTHNEGWEIPEL